MDEKTLETYQLIFKGLKSTNLVKEKDRESATDFFAKVHKHSERAIIDKVDNKIEKIRDKINNYYVTKEYLSAKYISKQEFSYKWALILTSVAVTVLISMALGINLKDIIHPYLNFRG